MAGLNKVMVIGNLGADPEMRYMADGTALTSFSVAASRSYNGPDGERKEETEWFSVVAWRKLAEQCSQFLQKGKKVYVEGRLRTHSWDTPEGQRRYKTEVVAYRVLFLDRAGGAPSGEEHDAMMDIEPEDVPFE
ncbi:MAG: single-stranded DNA-binding protein [Dehalococcoidia bacterium]